MVVAGKLYKKFPTMEVGANKFLKREFVLELTDNPQYPQLVKFEMTGDRCSILDQFETGEVVEIKFDLRGREWTNKMNEVVYFNTLSAYQMTRMGNSGGGETPAPSAYKAPAPAEPFGAPAGGGFSSESASDDSDLPF